MSSDGSWGGGSGGHGSRNFPPAVIPVQGTPDGYVVLRFFPTLVGLLAVAWLGVVCGEYYRDLPGRGGDRWGFEDRGGAALVYDPGSGGRSGSWGARGDPRAVGPAGRQGAPGAGPIRVDGPAGIFKNGPAPGPSEVNEGVERVLGEFQGFVSADRPATALCLMGELAEEISYLPFVPEHHAAWIMDSVESATGRLMQKHQEGPAPDGKPWLDAAQVEALKRVTQITPAGDPTGDIAKFNQALGAARASICALGEREKPR